MMDDDEDEGDMLCHMAGKLTASTFQGTWAFEPESTFEVALRLPDR